MLWQAVGVSETLMMRVSIPSFGHSAACSRLPIGQLVCRATAKREQRVVARGRSQLDTDMYLHTEMFQEIANDTSNRLVFWCDIGVCCSLRVATSSVGETGRSDNF